MCLSAQELVGRSATLRLNGKVERSHGIDAEELYRLLEGVVWATLVTFNGKLKAWRTTATTAGPVRGYFRCVTRNIRWQQVGDFEFLNPSSPS